MPEAKLQEHFFPHATRTHGQKSPAWATRVCRRVAIAALFLAMPVSPAFGAEAPCDGALVQKVQAPRRERNTLGQSIVPPRQNPKTGKFAEAPG